MRLSYKSLLEWVPSAPSPGEVADILLARGFAVDSLEPQARFSGVLVGRVLEREQHPNADRLSLCKVDVGAGGVLEIVCGAPNARAGITVAVAVEGARLSGGVLKKSKIRGVVSNGMLCSGKELELGQDADGILELDAALEAGADFAIACGLDDTLLEVDVPYNRGDALSVRGLARELAAALGVTLAGAAESVPHAAGPLPGVEVSIEDPGDCPRYLARVVRGVRIGPSPAWLRVRVEALGMRSISNVVDATNLTMLVLGQPIHAFDAARVQAGTLQVRRARVGESLQTLDGVERPLVPEVLVIADASGPLALAGLMGGASSEVRETTSEVLLESACFGPERVRMGARALKLTSEAARRFERGIDEHAAAEALDHVAALLAQVAQGQVVPQRLDAWPGRAPARRVPLRAERVGLLLAGHVAESEIAGLLTGLGFVAAETSEDRTWWEVPSWRRDVEQEVDLIEEVARSRGYDRIAEDAGMVSPLSSSLGEREGFRREVRGRMLGLGFFEAQVSSLLGPDELQFLPDLPPGAGREAPELANPLSRELSFLRPSLAPGLLMAAGRNARHGRSDVRLFDLGRIFLDAGAGFPDESEWLGMVACGAVHTAGVGQGNNRLDFAGFKGLVEALLEALHVDNPRYLSYDGRGLHPGRGARVEWRGQLLGHLGEVDPALRDRVELKETAFIAELSASLLQQAWGKPRRFADWSRFPAVHRDLAFLVELGSAAQDCCEAIRSAAGPWLVGVDLFDSYTGDRVEAGRKNLAFSLQFQAPDRTLSDAEVDQAVRGVVERLEKVGARLR